ncbi:TIGR03619 family F420-dependent LLM class oxidoreductase [Spirillospora sp. NPDC047279]|uniref:TIGR03619 family F420-dependent LLM class oxidoreductase n=1 Tax=Spirillospora sp. NPDC047279 TaxID=3155478 RepID=UPI0033FD8A5E
MHIGFAVPVSGAWAAPGNQVLIAQEAESLGYRSLWTLQRLVTPAGSADATYRGVPDPLVTLGYLAGFTETIRLGVAIVNLPFVSPALLAKQAATLDHLSGGRLDLGLGLGWMPEEFAVSGAPIERRGARAEEFLAALRSLWHDEASEFHGEFYDFPPVRMEPAPVQSPEPPILLGGASDPALRRAGRLAAGWISSSRADPAGLARSVGVVRDAAEKAGRDPGALRFVCRAAVRVGPAGAAGRTPLTGSYEEIRGDLARIAEQGMTEAFVDLNFDPELTSATDAVPRANEALAEFAPR